MFIEKQLSLFILLLTTAMFMVAMVTDGQQDAAGIVANCVKTALIGTDADPSSCITFIFHGLNQTVTKAFSNNITGQMRSFWFQTVMTIQEALNVTLTTQQKHDISTLLVMFTLGKTDGNSLDQLDMYIESVFTDQQQVEKIEDVLKDAIPLQKTALHQSITDFLTQTGAKLGNKGGKKSV